MSSDAGAGGHEFGNEPISSSGLPQLEGHEIERLAPAYRRLRLAAALTAGGLVSLGTVVVAVLSASWSALVVGTAIVGVIAIVGVVHHLEVEHMGYLIREHDLSFWSGVISRSVATVPFARVQHVSIGRGPLDRRFGLATLQLRSAGGHVAIPGLDHRVAEQLKELVADRAATLAEAEIDGDGA